MKKKNILTKVVLLIVGAFLVFLLLELIFDWRGSVESFKQGFNEAGGMQIEETK